MANAALHKSKAIIRRTAWATHVGLVLPLDLMIRLYGDTDKSAHRYTLYYRQHFRGMRWHQNRLVEIGVGGYESRRPGGSLRVWRDFFPLSRIVGFDICDKEIDLGPRVKFVRGDQSKTADLQLAVRALGGPPNIVIDDGSHYGDHAETSFRYLFGLMPSGSIYVIEDLHTSYWSEFGGAVPAPDRSGVGFVRALVNAVQTRDPTFALPQCRTYGRPAVDGALDQVAGVWVYPGIVFIKKA